MLGEQTLVMFVCTARSVKKRHVTAINATLKSAIKRFRKKTSKVSVAITDGMYY